MKPTPTTASQLPATQIFVAAGALPVAREVETYQHYEVLRREDGSLWELGRGAMGVTYKAFDTNLRCPVALKVISTHYLESDTATQRFVREAQIAARLRHPNIAAVYHLGTDPQNFFYAMEFIEGETLEDRVERDGPLPLETVLRIGLQASRALAAASRQGLIHRDVKPANLMVTEQPDEGEDRLLVKMIDFGLARSYAADDSQPNVTHSGFVGTPIYASPEQLEEHDLDVRSDIYSLGITLWVLLTGQPPFVGKMTQVITQHLTAPPPWWQLGQCAEPVRGLFERMLKKNRTERFQSAGELRAALEQCLAAVTGKAIAPAAATIAGPGVMAPLPTKIISPPRGLPPHTGTAPTGPASSLTFSLTLLIRQWRLSLIVAAVAVLVGVCVLLFWSRAEGTAGTAKSSTTTPPPRVISGLAAASIESASARVAAETPVSARATPSVSAPPARQDINPTPEDSVLQPLEGSPVEMGASTPAKDLAATDASPAPDAAASPGPTATPVPGVDHDEADKDAADVSGKAKPGNGHVTRTRRHSAPTPAPNFFQRLFGIKPTKGR